MKNVIIRTFDMRRVVVPNATFLKKAVKTYSAEEFLRLESDVILDIHCDAEIFMQGILEIVNEFPFVMNKQYTQVLLDGFDDKKIKFKVQLFYNPNG
jgi:small-conductance mechanosensitive channel